MPKRSSYNIKKRILHILKEDSATYAHLERKVNTGFRTIKENCKELELHGEIDIIKHNNHPSNGRNYVEIKITPHGIKFLERLKKLKE